MKNYRTRSSTSHTAAVPSKRRLASCVKWMAVVALSLAGQAGAATIRVPQDQATITAGIAAASPGDTVAVSPGTYNEYNIPITKPVTVTSVGNATNTIVDMQHNGRGFLITNSASTAVNLLGLTIQNATIPYYSGGGAVLIVSGKCRISGCIIQGTSGAADYSGGPISNWSTNIDDVLLDNCVVRNNFAANGCAISGCAAYRCLIYNNSAGNNPMALSGCHATNCTVYNNTGGFLGNSWTAGGLAGGIAVNCIFWGNSGHNGQQIDPGSSATVTYSTVQGGFTGTGNLNADPLFVNAGNGDFHLQTNSPAANAGDPSIFNVNGSRSDMGAYGGVPTEVRQDLNFVWAKLLSSANMPVLDGDNGWRSLPGSFDESRRIVYSLSANGVFWKYDIASNLFTQLPVIGTWPGPVGTFIYNPDENAIWFTLRGRGQVFRLPVTGGAFTSVGASGDSYADFGDITYWNPVTHKFATFNGYGFMAVRNWRWEFGTTDSDWVQTEANAPGRQPWPRAGGSWTVDNTGQRVFHGGGEGNSSGGQGQVDAGFDYFMGDTRFDALRDLWLLDLKSNKWVNLIPLNTAIRHFGPLVYYPPQTKLLMINGQNTLSGAFETGIWTFTIGQDTNFTQATISGEIPKASDDPGGLSFPYYDSASKRVIYFNTNGVYALSLASSSQNFLTNGLVAYYPFNGNANDASGNGNNASVQGAYQYLTNGTLHLVGDGSLFYSGGGYVSLPNFDNLSSGFTMSLWVGNETDHGTSIMSECYVNCWSTSGKNLWIGQHDVYFGDSYANAYFPLTITNYAAWKQLVVTCSPTNCSLFLNGLSVGNTNVTVSPFPTVNSAIGRHWWAGGANSSARMTMDVKNFRMYNRGLSASEVQQLYAYESTPQPITPPSITTQPASQSVNQGSPASFSVTANGTGLGYQWRLNSAAISGATNASYGIASVTTNHAGTYTVVVSNTGGSVTSSNAVLAVIPPPRTGSGTAALVGSFVVTVNITDGGCGYTNTPLVRFVGGGGSGAQATAVVSNGVITAINVFDAGYGYTSAPLVVIDPPFIPNPILSIAPMSYLAFSNLTVGGVYQLQRSVAWYWSNQPVSFTATNDLYAQMVAGVAGSEDYRLALNPVPAQAFATAVVNYGFVVHATVNSGGSGYVTSPAVTISGGGGVNATAVSHVTGGVVTDISISSAGFGYTNTPAIRIAAPPAAAVAPTVWPVMRVDSRNLTPYDNYQVQFKPELDGAWGNWDGGLFTSAGGTNSQYLFITNGPGLFRLQYVP